MERKIKIGDVPKHTINNIVSEDAWFNYQNREIVELFHKSSSPSLIYLDSHTASFSDDFLIFESDDHYAMWLLKWS